MKDCDHDLTLSQTSNFRLFQLKEYADDSFNFDENGRKFIMSDFSFSYSVFKKFVLQKHKNQGLFRKGLMMDRSP